MELTNVNSKGGRGWFSFCEADYLAYGDAVNKVFYMIPLADLKKKVKEVNCREARCGYDSTGLLINLKDIADIVSKL